MKKAMIKRAAVLCFLLLILLAFPACTEKTKTGKEGTKALTVEKSTGIKSAGEAAGSAISDEELAELEAEINQIDMLMQDIESEEEIEVGDFSGI